MAESTSEQLLRASQVTGVPSYLLAALSAEDLDNVVNQVASGKMSTTDIISRLGTASPDQRLSAFLQGTPAVQPPPDIVQKPPQFERAPELPPPQQAITKTIQAPPLARADNQLQGFLDRINAGEDPNAVNADFQYTNAGTNVEQNPLITGDTGGVEFPGGIRRGIAAPPPPPTTALPPVGQPPAQPPAQPPVQPPVQPPAQPPQVIWEAQPTGPTTGPGYVNPVTQTPQVTPLDLPPPPTSQIGVGQKSVASPAVPVTTTPIYPFGKMASGQPMSVPNLQLGTAGSQNQQQQDWSQTPGSGGGSGPGGGYGPGSYSGGTWTTDPMGNPVWQPIIPENEMPYTDGQGPVRATKPATGEYSNAIDNLFNQLMAGKEGLITNVGQTDLGDIQKLMTSLFGLSALKGQDIYNTNFPQVLGAGSDLYNLSASNLNAPVDMPNAPTATDYGAKAVYEGGQPGAEWMDYIMNALTNVGIPKETLANFPVERLMDPTRYQGVEGAWTANADIEAERQRNLLKDYYGANNMLGSDIYREELARLENQLGATKADAMAKFMTATGGEQRADLSTAANILNALYGQKATGTGLSTGLLGQMAGTTGQAEGMDLARRDAEFARMGATDASQQQQYNNLFNQLLTTENIKSNRMGTSQNLLNSLLGALSGTNVSSQAVPNLDLAAMQAQDGASGAIGNFLGNTGSIGTAMLLKSLFGL